MVVVSDNVGSGTKRQTRLSQTGGNLTLRHVQAMTGKVNAVTAIHVYRIAQITKQPY